MKIANLLFLALLSVQAISQESNRNHVVLTPGLTEKEIIEKAISVVPSARQLRWQQLELTAFFHYGVNTFTNREWGTGKEDPRIFNPNRLDARQWVRVTKESGIKQVILTTKHHDGFCLWPTQTTQHSVKNSPWKNGMGDLVKEVADACREYQIGFGIYLSPWDMNAPVYGTEAYNDFFVAQLTELLTHYGQVDEVWFDGANGEGPNGKKQVYDFNRWYKLIRKLQPAATIAIMGPDVRWVGTETGYGREQEWSVVPTDNLDQEAISNESQTGIAFKPQGDMRGSDLGSREKIRHAKGLVWYPAETDVSIRPGWFYHPEEDKQVKTPDKLVDIYFNSVGRNGVLLLNIPPNKEGLISDADLQSLSGWKTKLDEIFAVNLLKKARIKGLTREQTALLTDGMDHTTIHPDQLVAGRSLEIDLGGEKTFNVLALQENIRKSQRIEGFEASYWDRNAWKILAKGTTIGYKRLLQFDTVTSSKIKLTVTNCRKEPYLAEMGIYLQKK